METQTTASGERDLIIHRPLGVEEKLNPCMDAMNGNRNPLRSYREKGGERESRERGERNQKRRKTEEAQERERDGGGGSSVGVDAQIQKFWLSNYGSRLRKGGTIDLGSSGKGEGGREERRE